MRNKYKISVILILLIVIIGGILFVLSYEKKREIELTDFKREHEYQFGEVAWNSTVEEVENMLNVTLEEITQASTKNYHCYSIPDGIYVLNGYEAKTTVEFQKDELVFVGFVFDELEDPITFFKDIISVWQDSYGSESEINETGIIVTYKWKTKTTQLAVTFNKNRKNVTIFLFTFN